MRSRKIWFGIVGVVSITVIAVFIFISQNASQTSQVVVSDVNCVSTIDSDSCILFPIITGDSLTGVPYTLPESLEGEYRFVIVPFDREQQSRAQTWLPYAQGLAAQYPDLNFYNVPVFPDLPALVRTVARTGLIALMSEQEQAFTITVFLEDRDTFLTAMDIPDVEQIQIFLLNTQGEVLWRSIGEFAEAKITDLSQLLEDAHTG